MKSTWLAVGLCLSVTASLSAAGPEQAAGFPQSVSYQGEALDAAGQPLSGNHEMTFLYFSSAGELLLGEGMPVVAVFEGRFEVRLGTGQLVGPGKYPSLSSAFAKHPEVEMEVVVDGTIQEPRLGILPAGHSLKSRLVAAGLRPEQDNEVHWRGYTVASDVTAIQSGVLAPKGTRPVLPAQEGSVWRRPYTLPVVGPSLSPEVRSLPIAEVQPLADDAREVNRPRHESLFDDQGRRFGTATEKIDDPLAEAAETGLRTPPLSASFEGLNNISGVLPPDTEMAVGPNHVVQVANLVFAVYSKTGTLLAGPSNTNTLWAGFGGPCQSDNSGDAVFLYDRLANRFVLTQFAVASGHRSVCWAVSQTADPLGAYYRYEVVTPRFPDYFKVGTWPAANNNAYFFGTNSGFQGAYDVFAVDRERMLLGQAARPMQFFQSFANLLMPADLDGSTGPAASAPGLLYTFRDGGEPYFGSPPSDSIDLYAFDVDWSSPSSTTLTLTTSITPAQGLANFNWTVCGFFVQNCIPQPGTAQGIDSSSWWPMQRLVYRNFGSHQALAGTWTVDVNSAGNRAAPRWFELRNAGSGWSIFQQGTHSPDTIHRFMPSIAMDGSGNVALGYSRSNGSNFPSIYYATHETTDPLGSMQAEALLFAGTGSQTSSFARWGDYSSMEIDPADDCTFWYTSEYLATTGSAPWRTRVGSFKVASCGLPENQPPVCQADSLSTPRDTLLSIFFNTLLANDSDPDGDNLWVIAYDFVTAQGGSNDFGHVSGFNYTPPPGFTGLDWFSYTLSDRGDATGLTDTCTVFVDVTVNQPPTARFSFTCSGLSCSFDSSASADDGLITSRNWSVGGTSFGSGVTASRVFAATGSYTVTLTVTDNGGLQNSISRKVSVNGDPPLSAESYFSIAPCRLVETKDGPPLAGNQLHVFNVAGSCGIPTTAKAVSLNIAVAEATAAGHLVFFPGNQTSGPFQNSTLNFIPDPIRRFNNAVLRLATNGAGTLAMVANMAVAPAEFHLSLWTDGYFSEDASPAPGAVGPLGFQALTPCRIVNTTTGPPLTHNVSQPFAVQGACGVPTATPTAALNLTVLGPAEAGQLRVFPADTVATMGILRFPAGTIARANGARPQLTSTTPDARVMFTATSGATANALLDTYGYFKSDAPLRYRPITPCRLLDTRLVDQGAPAFAPGEVRDIQVQGNCGVPVGAKAAVLNVTAVSPSTAGHLWLAPSGGAPPIPTLSFDPTQGNLANGVFVALSTQSNDLAVKCTFSSTHVVIDVFGYFQ